MSMTVEQIREFIRSNAVPLEDARSLAIRATSPDYWRSLCPRMSVSPGPAHPGNDEVFSPDVIEALDEYSRCGYCACEQVFPTAEIARLAASVFEVQRAGWPLAFSFIYDQFWTILRASKLDAFLTKLLGNRYQTSPRFWVNYVPPKTESSGFPPHVDGGRDHTVTCWVPLTNALPDNGCMYVVEKTPASNKVLAEFNTVNMFTRQQVSLLLAHARALPLPPGGFLAWPHNTVHWGGMFRRGEARLALSWEFMPEAVENIDAQLSLALRREKFLPAFEDRLRWICHSVGRFEGRDMILTRFMPVIHEIRRLTTHI